MTKKDKGFHVITFKSVSYAIRAEKKLIGNKEVHIIPTPREITATCGMALRVDNSSESELLEMYKSIEDPEGLYKLGPKSEGKRPIQAITIK